jgi:hypothetical protein
MIKNRFASKKDIKTDWVDILQTLMLAKKRQGIRKKGKKELSTPRLVARPKAISFTIR